jgi:hypothetical protein
MENSKRFWTASLGWGFLLGAVALACMALAGGGDARAANLKTLWNFCAQGTATCPDGQSPSSGLISDGSGGFYGTTFSGGAYGGGTVFQMIRTQSANGQPSWKIKTLHNFCAEGGANCTDGAVPLAWNLLKDEWGNLYGTTINGGANTTYENPCNSPVDPCALGTVYLLSPKVGADGQTTWTHKVLHNFCAEGGAKCTDGKAPVTGLIMDAAGNLYGAAEQGGAQNANCIAGSCGTVYELVRNRDADGQTTWKYKVLHTFCEQGGRNCADGSDPVTGLLLSDGRLYGGTARGGAHTADDLVGGTVFELTPSGGANTQNGWTLKTLYSFCAQPNCSDGAYSYEQSLLIGQAGNFYGVAAMGGIRNPNCFYPSNVPPSQAGCGVVFELAPNAAKTAWTERVLYSFCQQGGNNCTDGATPIGGLIRDPAGRLYGTTLFGGAHGTASTYGGTVFELTPKPNASGETTWSHAILYSFCAEGGANCVDGTRQERPHLPRKGELKGSGSRAGIVRYSKA